MDKPILISGPTGPYAHGYKMCRVRYGDGTIKMITWHKFLYEQKYGKLLKNMHVHHKNGDKEDNRLENLEATTMSKHASHHWQRPTPTQIYICPWCGNNFEREDSVVRHNQYVQNSAGPFCSRSCGASWGREKQLGRL
jgi:hypothetical protein